MLLTRGKTMKIVKIHGENDENSTGLTTEWGQTFLHCGRLRHRVGFAAYRVWTPALARIWTGPQRLQRIDVVQYSERFDCRAISTWSS